MNPATVASPAGSVAATEPADASSVAPAGSRKRSLRQRAVRATTIRAGGFAASKGIQLSTNVALAYLIGTPRAWGVLIIAQAMLQGLKMFSEVGIGPAIIQSKRGTDPVFLDTAWTLQAMRGCGIWLAGCALAWPLARLYNEPLLMWMLPVMALANLLAGLQSTRVFTLNRQLAEGKRTALDLVERMTTRCSSVAFAFITPTAWAFVGGSLVGHVVMTVGTHTYLPGHRNRFRINAGAARELLHFGKWIFAGTVIAFFTQQADRLMLGKIDDLSVLGVYGIALTVSKLPQEMIGALTTAVVFPVFAELARSKPERHQEMVRRVRGAVLTPTMTAVVAVALIAPWFFNLAYPVAFREAGWMAAMSVVAVWIGVLDMTTNKALLSIGATRPLAVGGLVDLIVTVAGCLAGYRLFGMPGFIGGTIVGAACGYAYIQRSALRHGIGVMSQDLRWTCLALAIGGGGYAMGRVLTGLVDGQWSAVVGVGWAAMVVGCVGVWAARRTWRIVRTRPR